MGMGGMGMMVRPPSEPARPLRRRLAPVPRLSLLLSSPPRPCSPATKSGTTKKRLTQVNVVAIAQGMQGMGDMEMPEQPPMSRIQKLSMKLMPLMSVMQMPMMMMTQVMSMVQMQMMGMMSGFQMGVEMLMQMGQVRRTPSRFASRYRL